MGAMSANQKATDPSSLGVESQETEGGTDQATNSAFVRSFNLLLGLVVALGLVVRIAFVSLVNLPPVGLDALWYRAAASNLVDGRGYVTPSLAAPHELVATRGPSTPFPRPLGGIQPTRAALGGRPATRPGPRDVQLRPCDGPVGAEGRWSVCRHRRCADRSIEPAVAWFRWGAPKRKHLPHRHRADVVVGA